MRAFHFGELYEFPDEWWQEAGLAGFSPPQSTYVPDYAAFRDLEVVEVPITGISPVRRRLSHGVFNDSPEHGSAHDRVLRILRGFRLGDAIPPIEVRRSVDGAQPFELHHGAHRFCCSVIAGYSAVPAIDVTDELAKI